MFTVLKSNMNDKYGVHTHALLLLLSLTNTYIQTHTHKHILTNTHTHTLTNKHTHTLSIPLFQSLSLVSVKRGAVN